MQELLATSWSRCQLGPGLRSPLPEVRQRALRSLQFKLQNGLLAPEALARDASLLSNLLGCFGSSGEDETSRAVALEVLCVLAQHPGVAAALLALGADQAVFSHQGSLPHHLASLANQLLGAMYLGQRVKSGSNSNAAESFDLLPCYTVPAASGGGLYQPAPSSPLALPCFNMGVCCSSPGGGELLAASTPSTLCSPQSKAWVLKSRQGPRGANAQKEFLARHSLHVRAVQLSQVDAQQLEDLCSQLAQSQSETATRMALLQLRAGALADIPAEGILARTGIVPALLGLVADGGGAASNALPTAAMECLHAIVLDLATAMVSAGSPPEAAPVGPLAHQMLQTCAVALRDFRLHHIAVPLLAAVLPLTRPAGVLAVQSADAMAFTASWRAALASLADALHLSMVAACIDAGIVPQNDWESGSLGIVVDVRVKLLGDLAACFLDTIPAEHLAEAMPDALRPLLAGLFSSPLASSLLPRVQAAMAPYVGMLAPQTLQSLEAAACLASRKAQLLSAVAQLTEICSSGREASGTVLAACCREMLGCLAAMTLLGRQEVEGAVRNVVRSCAACCGLHAAPPGLAERVAAAALAHPLPAARHVAVHALADEAANGGLSLALVLQPLVLGALVTVGLADEEMQHHVLHALQRTIAHDSKAASAALLAWQLWLVCYRNHPAPVGPIISSLLQVAQQAPEAGLWHRLQPQLLDLFSSDASLVSEAASQLFSALVGQGGPLCAIMQFSLQPLSGLLVAGEQGGTLLRQRGRDAVAAHLFSSEDVQGLLHAASSPAVPPEVGAQALMQLAHVACDSRFHAALGSGQVLEMLVDRIQARRSPGNDLLQPALDCLVQVLDNVPAAPSWFFEDADRRALPLAQLAFHPIPAIRYMAAQALHHLLVVTSTAQWLELQRQLSLEPVAALQPGIPQWGIVAEPFARLRLFPQAHAAVVKVAPGRLLSVSGGEDGCFGEEVQRLWEAQQVVQAAASTDGGLAALLAEEGALMQPWLHSFMRSSLATLEYLDLEAQLGRALQRLQHSKSHQDCHAALATIKLLCCTEQGVDVLARQAWCAALQFLIARAPLSSDDVQLWAALLPLLRQIVGSLHSAPDDLLLHATKFVGGSGLEWLAGAAPDPADSEASTATYQLMQEVVELCSDVVERCMVSALAPGQILATLQIEPWMQQLLGSICNEVGPYSARLAAGRFLVTLTQFVHYTAAGAGGGGQPGAWMPEAIQAALLGSIPQLLRHVLMAKDWWHPEHFHGKALIMHLLRHLQGVTQVLPASQWAAAWAEVGGTYWLSRLAKDQQACMREVAFGLLAALALPKPTYAMLALGWPECGSAACRVAADTGECTRVRAAALRVVVAAMSHAAAGVELGSHTEEGAQGRQRCTLSTAFLMEHAPLWAAAAEAIQDSDCPSYLLAAAAHALLQRALADTGGAWELLSGEGKCAAVANLFSAPVRLARQYSPPPGGDSTGSRAGAGCAQWPATAVGWEQLGDTLEAAAAGAELLAVLLQFLPEAQPLLCQDITLEPALSCCALAAALGSTSLAVGAPPVAHAVRAAAWPALAALANAAALLLAAKGAWEEEVVRSGAAGGPVPLAVAVVHAMQLACSNQAVADACNRLLQVLLHRPDFAAVFLQDPTGQEHALQDRSQGSTVGSQLCMQLVERFLSHQESSQAGPEPAVPAVLRSLLAYSHPAKAVAVQMSLHSSLLEACNSLAGALAAGAQKVTSSRAGKLQLLKKKHAAAVVATTAGLQAPQRRPATGIRPPKAGARKEVATPRGAGSGAEDQQEQADTQVVGSAAAGSEQCGEENLGQWSGGAAAPGQDQAQRSMQRLLLFIDLLQQMAFKSQLASDALCAGGLAAISSDTLWRLGTSSSPAMLALLELLAHASASSKDMRLSWVAAGAKGSGRLLAQLTAAVLRPTLPLPVHRQAAATLSTFLATPDGCSAALRAELLPQALRSVQDYMATKDWARLGGVLQVLTSLASQPEGQKALPRTTAPCGSLLDLLLGLVQHHMPAVAAQAALVLRNTALLLENKAHFLSRAGALQTFVDALGETAQQPARAAYAAGALWALMHQGEKVKATLRRSTGLAGVISAAVSACATALEADDSRAQGKLRGELITACESLALLLS